jgi:hypothetical protein
MIEKQLNRPAPPALCLARSLGRRASIGPEPSPPSTFSLKIGVGMRGGPA